jgi:hypothetical protein
LVEQSLRKREVGGSSPSTGTSASLPLKLALTLASVIVYLGIWEVAEAIEHLESFPNPWLWFHYLAGAVFGAAVLGPYAVPRRRALQVLALAVAGAAIYYLAVWFVAEGPISYKSIASFVVAGSGAALLCGLAVVATTFRPLGARLIALTVLAGAIGGATFELEMAFDDVLFVPHAAWQVLVCLALHFGFRSPRT